jgi:hypothetical protein
MNYLYQVMRSWIPDREEPYPPKGPIIQRHLSQTGRQDWINLGARRPVINPNAALGAHQTSWRNHESL